MVNLNFIHSDNILQSKRHFISFIKEVKIDKTWQITNETLYKLCKKYPDHKISSEIIAKAIIIGRVYAASLERGDSTGKKKGDEFYRTDVVNTFKDFFNKRDVKNHLRKLRVGSNIETGCIIHSQFVETLKTLRSIQKNSFASKYLHFHFPKSFYILDSRVKKSISTIERYLTCRSRVKARNVPLYARYVRRFEAVKQRIKEQTGITLSPRELDTLLIRVANSN